MAITKTREELVREAADKLDLVGTGQPLEAEYSAEIDGSVDPLLRQLSADGICHVANSDAIPHEWFDAIAGLLANIRGSLGGKGFDPRLKEYYEMQLRRVTAARPQYAVLGMDFF